jgi:hypothetical protein
LVFTPSSLLALLDNRGSEKEALAQWWLMKMGDGGMILHVWLMHVLWQLLHGNDNELLVSMAILVASPSSRRETQASSSSSRGFTLAVVWQSTLILPQVVASLAVAEMLTSGFAPAVDPTELIAFS